MAIALVQDAYHSVSPGTSITVGTGSDNPLATPTAGNLLVAHFTGTLSPGTLTISGWTQLAYATTNDGATVDAWFAKLATAADTSIAGNSTLSDNLHLHISEWSDMGDAWSLHQLGTPTQATSTATTLAAPSVTTTIADALALCGWSFTGGLPGTTNTYTNSFTTLSANQRGRTAYKILSATGAVTSTHTWSTARTAIAQTLVLVPGTSGGGGGGGSLYYSAGPIRFG